MAPDDADSRTRFAGVVSAVGVAVVVLVASGVLIAWSFTRSGARLVGEHERLERSPLDEAERILAARYAAGSITPQEYRRMLAILRT